MGGGLGRAAVKDREDSCDEAEGGESAGWLEDGEKLGTSAIAWSEFCNGHLTAAQKDAVFAVLERRVSDFTARHAEEASRLFHRTGRRRGSHADCMIAAAAMAVGVPVATIES